MPLYQYRCGKGHLDERVFRVDRKPETIRCSLCGSRAKSVIATAPNIGSCWPEGKRFEHIDGRTFKSYKEMDKYAESVGGHVEAPSAQTISRRREERAHRALQRKKVLPKKFKTPAVVEKAFRECPTVDAAVKALKENRV